MIKFLTGDKPEQRKEEETEEEEGNPKAQKFKSRNLVQGLTGKNELGVRMK